VSACLRCCRQLGCQGNDTPQRLLGSFFGVPRLQIVLFIQPDVHDVSLVQGFALVATGILSVFATVCYLYALDIDEASFVTPFNQTVPIFAYFFGNFILGETITLARGLGSFVIIGNLELCVFPSPGGPADCGVELG
jgi:drug/metabolite transporter (DMT)-like permease